MTIQKALDMTDKMMPNFMEKQLKLDFLTEIEQVIHQEIIMKHEHTQEQETLPVYDIDTDPGTALAIPDPYSMLYVYYLLSKIDEQNLEFDKYNAHRALFEYHYERMNDWYTRNHMPITFVREFRL